MNDVLIVGAGPVGLFLAAELKLQGITPVVIDRLERPTGLSKALGVQGAGVDLLEARGLLPLFLAEATRPLGGGFHFAHIPLDEPTRFLFVLQSRVEAVLERHLESLGVRVRRGVELQSFEQSSDRVQAHVGTETLDARYLVGCDGGSSVVRNIAGIDFPGTEPTMLIRLGDVRLPGVALTPQGQVPDGNRAPFRVGMPLDDGYFRVISREPYPPGFDRKSPMSLEELQASVKRQTGRDIPMTEPRWLSRFTDVSRQAAQYRKGRVLLAGDAAHIHLPAGGPGISTGLNDAANLGWRLAAVLQGHHDETWLDDYGTERHAAGEKVLQHTRAQAVLMTQTAHTLALRELLTELFSVPEARRFIARRVQGLDTRYGGSPNPLEGAWMPEPLDLSAGRFVLIANGFDNRWGARLEVKSGDRPMLIRPDGFVAWAGEGEPTDAVAHWLGKP